jgi:hypothetical protein
MTSTNATSRKSKRDDPKRSSAPIIVVAANEQQVTKVSFSFHLISLNKF